MVVATHPDDETLGCGGTLLKHKAAGDKIFWLIVTSMKSGGGYSEKRIAEREREIARVARMFGFDGVYNLGMTAAALDSVPKQKLVKEIGGIVSIAKPGIVYLPFRGDVHSDHGAVFSAAYNCTKTFRYPYVKRVLMMETISETEFALPEGRSSFRPNSFSDISKYLHRKIEIMKEYKSEIGKHPFPRSVKNIEALATFRGAMSGCRYSEAFMLIKEIL